MSVFLTIIRRNFLVTWTAPIWVIISLLQPLFWVLAFARLFEPVPVSVGGVNYEYLSYFTPGILAATTIFSSMWAGIGFAYDRKSGLLNRFRLAGASNLTILLAYVLQSLTSILFQAILVLFLCQALGADLNLTPATFLVLLLVILLLAFSISSLSHLMVIVMSNEMALVNVNGFLSLPILFLSSALFPLESAPAWMRVVAQVNPLQHTSELARSLLLKMSGNDFSVLSLVVIFVSAILLFFAAVYTLNRQRTI